MTSHTAMKHIMKNKGHKAITNPLLSTTMICIEGTAAVVSGEIDGKGEDERRYI